MGTHAGAVAGQSADVLHVGVHAFDALGSQACPLGQQHSLVCSADACSVSQLAPATVPQLVAGSWFLETKL
jgi:hypothetical protein